MNLKGEIMKGPQIKTIDDIYWLSIERRSVVCKRFANRKPKPAAFIIRLQGAIIYKLIQDGMWFYEKRNKLDKDKL